MLQREEVFGFDEAFCDAEHLGITQEIVELGSVAALQFDQGERAMLARYDTSFWFSPRMMRRSRNFAPICSTSSMTIPYKVATSKL